MNRNTNNIIPCIKRRLKIELWSKLNIANTKHFPQIIETTSRVTTTMTSFVTSNNCFANVRDAISMFGFGNNQTFLIFNLNNQCYLISETFFSKTMYGLRWSKFDPIWCNFSNFVELIITVKTSNAHPCQPKNLPWPQRWTLQPDDSRRAFFFTKTIQLKNVCEPIKTTMMRFKTLRKRKY